MTRGIVANFIITAILLISFPIPGSSGDRKPGIAHNSHEAFNICGLKKLNERNFSGAKKMFEKAIEMSPESKHYYNNMAVACINNGDYTQSSIYLKKAIRLDPRYSRALYNMAVVCFYQLDFKGACRYYLSARRSNPHYVKSRFSKKKFLDKISHLKKQNPGNMELDKLHEYVNNTDERQLP